MFHTAVVNCGDLLEGLRPVGLNCFSGVTMDQISFPSLIGGKGILHCRLVLSDLASKIWYDKLACNKSSSLRVSYGQKDKRPNFVV